MGPRFRVSSKRLEKPGIEPTIPGLEGEQLNHYATEASQYFYLFCFVVVVVFFVFVFFFNYKSASLLLVYLLVRRDVPVGAPLDLSTPTGMRCIGTYGENFKADNVSKYRVLLVAFLLS